MTPENFGSIDLGTKKRGGKCLTCLLGLGGVVGRKMDVKWE